MGKIIATLTITLVTIYSSRRKQDSINAEGAL